MRPAFLCLVAAGLVAGCVFPPTSSQVLAQRAHDFNAATRFGRMDLALEDVREATRSDFSRRHAAWGRTIRIVDWEFGGVSFLPDGDAEVHVTVSWQRIDESSLRTTEISQRWSQIRGTWWMIAETEVSGDKGLLAEPPAAAPEGQPKAAPPPAPRPLPTVIYEQ